MSVRFSYGDIHDYCLDVLANTTAGNLKKLALLSCEDLKGSGVAQCAEKCENLAFLVLCGTFEQSGATLTAIASQFKRLEGLRIQQSVGFPPYGPLSLPANTLKYLSLVSLEIKR